MPPPRPNWAHQTIWTGDNLDIMRGMNSASVDLIYLDPPFNSNADYAAPIGSKAAGAEFKDTWGLSDINLAWHGLIKSEHPGLYDMLRSVRQIHGDSMMSYLIYMAPRLMEMRRLLKDTGSVYLHCDPTASHYLKLMMDAIYGQKNFLNEIVWFYNDSPGGRTSKWFPRKHDVIISYADKRGNHTFNRDAVKIPIKEASAKRYQSPRKIGGKEYTQGDASGKTPEDVWQIPVIKKHAGSKEATGYPTQKPLTLVERIISASSNTGDMILDPFCGCATACIAAQKLDREWVGIDISPKAAELTKLRMEKDLGLFWKGTHRSDIPKRTDQGQLPPYNSQENRKRLYGEQGGYCNGCAHHFELRNLTVDHIIPTSKGGTDHISNLQLLCGNCNSIKGNRTQEWLLDRLLEKDFVKRRLKEDSN